jgi:sterol desaturase/sphingolipid hydroxylase (fatty acid hydroxylase superfamily)
MKINDNILIHAIPCFLLLIAVEFLYQRKEHPQAERKKQILADMGIGLGATIISFLTNGIIIFVYSLIYQYRFFDLPATSWWAWLICFFGDDFSWYWFHRLSHQIRFLWASHSVHHSPEVFSLSGGMRVPWTSNFTGNFLFWAWLPLLGIEPAMIVFMKALSVIYQFWLHTEMIRKMPGWFEVFFNTPSHHRVHHGSDIDYLDKNHGGFLIIWDKLFGTFQKETHKTIYGLTKKISSTNPFIIAVHEWKNLFKDLKKANKLKDYLNYIFNSPGWSNDGSSKTTRQLRASPGSDKQESVRN